MGAERWKKGIGVRIRLHRSATPAENDGGKFLANERLLRSCVETNGASPVGVRLLEDEATGKKRFTRSHQPEV